MSNIIKTTVTKPAEYRDYQHFLGGYRNGKKEDCDSGINSPLDKSVNSSTTSVYSDLLEDCSGRMKTEICIEVNKPVKKTVLDRRGSVKKMTQIFDGGNGGTIRNGRPSLEKLLMRDQADGNVAMGKVLLKDQGDGRPNLEKLLMKDQVDGVVNKSKAEKPSLEKLLQEDQLNSQLNIKDSQAVAKQIVTVNVKLDVKPALVAAKPPLVEMKPSLVEVKPPLVEVKPPLVEVKPPLMEVKQPSVEVKHNNLPPQDKIFYKSEASMDSENIFTTLRKKDDDCVVQTDNLATAPLPPPPPPPMPTTIPTIRKSSTLPKTKPPTPKTATDLNDRLENERKKLAYEALRGIMGNYHQQANVIASTLPRNHSIPNGKIGNIINTMALNGDLDKIKGRSAPKTE